MTWAVLASVAFAGYALACWIWPFANCVVCSGSGKRRSPTGRAWRACGRCQGSGSRLRTGRAVWNVLSGVRQRGSR